MDNIIFNYLMKNHDLYIFKFKYYPNNLYKYNHMSKKKNIEFQYDDQGDALMNDYNIKLIIDHEKLY